MNISCEKCKSNFNIEDKKLTSKGNTVICPFCGHPHIVKRIVIPYGKEENKKPEPNPYKDTELIREIKEEKGDVTIHNSQKILDSTHPLIDSLEKDLKGDQRNKEEKNESSIKRLIRTNWEKYEDNLTRAKIDPNTFEFSELTLEKKVEPFSIQSQRDNPSTKSNTLLFILGTLTIGVILLGIIIYFGRFSLH